MERYRMGDKVMSRRLARQEERMRQDISRAKKGQWHIGKLSVYHEKRRCHPVIIEGKFHPEYSGVMIPTRIRIVYWGKSIFIKVIRLRGLA